MSLHCGQCEKAIRAEFMSLYLLGMNNEGLSFPNEDNSGPAMPGWVPDTSVCLDDFKLIPSDAAKTQPYEISDVVFGIELSQGRLKPGGSFAGSVELGTCSGQGIHAFVSGSIIERCLPQAWKRISKEYYTYNFPDKDIGLFPFRVVYSVKTGQCLYSVDARAKDPRMYVVELMTPGDAGKEILMDREEMRSGIISGMLGIYDRATSYEKKLDAFEKRVVAVFGKNVSFGND